MENHNTKTNPKIISLDLIRTAAITLVIASHINFGFFSAEAAPFLFRLFDGARCVGVPLFVILTGYLMLNRNYEDPSYLKKYISRNFLPLLLAFEFWNIAWNFLRYIYSPEGPHEWTEVLRAALFMDDTYSALWFLPMMIGLYLGIPIISIFIRKTEFGVYHKILLTALILCGTVIPTIVHLNEAFKFADNLHSVLKMNIFGVTVWGESVWMIYLLAGYAIYKGKFKSIKTPILLVFGICIPLCIIFAAGAKTAFNPAHYDFILFALISISLFEALTRLENRLQSHRAIPYVLDILSKTSFSAYMMHGTVAGVLYFAFSSATGLVMPICQSVSIWLCLIIFAIYIICILSLVYIVAAIVGKIDFIKKYILLMK